MQKNRYLFVWSVITFKIFNKLLKARLLKIVSVIVLTENILVFIQKSRIHNSKNVKAWSVCYVTVRVECKILFCAVGVVWWMIVFFLMVWIGIRWWMSWEDVFCLCFEKKGKRLNDSCNECMSQFLRKIKGVWDGSFRVDWWNSFTRWANVWMLLVECL